MKTKIFAKMNEADLRNLLTGKVVVLKGANSNEIVNLIMEDVGIFAIERITAECVNEVKEKLGYNKQ